MVASSDPDTATEQTIGIMCEHVRNAARDPLVIETARAARERFGQMAGDTDVAAQIAAGSWWWCKTFVKFVHHELILRNRLGEAGHLQGLISPEVLVRMKKPEGDCAIFSECVAAFLTTHGIPFEFVTVAANPREPEIFSHVYLYAVLPDGARLPLDASHGDYPGWQVPSAHVSRRQVWDANGNRVADRGSRFDGLHNYGMRGVGDIQSAWDTFIGGGGFDQYPNPYDYVTADTGAPYSGQVFQAPAQNSSQWGEFAASLARMGFDLARINAIQPGTVVSKDGAILRQNPGYAVGSPTIGANIGTGGGNLLLFGALGLGAVLLMSSMKGGR